MTCATSRSSGIGPAGHRLRTRIPDHAPDDSGEGEPMSRPTVVLVGTLDTKGTEYAFLRERLEDAGVATILVDVGTQGAAGTRADVPREEVAAAGGFDLALLTERGPA